MEEIIKEYDTTELNTMGKILKNARLLNILLIVLTLIIFIGFSVSNMTQNLTYTYIVLTLYKVGSATIFIVSIITFIRMQKYKLDGGILLLISSIISLIFSIFGRMLGIIVILLSTLSMRKIKENQEDLGIAK